MVSVEWDRPLILVHNLSLPILSVTQCYFHPQISSIIWSVYRATFTSWDKQANGSFRFRLSLVTWWRRWRSGRVRRKCSTKVSINANREIMWGSGIISYQFKYSPAVPWVCRICRSVWMGACLGCINLNTLQALWQQRKNERYSPSITINSEQKTFTT